MLHSGLWAARMLQCIVSDLLRHVSAIGLSYVRVSHAYMRLTSIQVHEPT